MPRDGSLDLLNEVDEIITNMTETMDIRPVKVKSALDHLRTSLDYLAYDAFEKYRPDNQDKDIRIYFPYGAASFIENFFIKKLKIIPPSSSPLHSIFNSIQDYQTGESWLKMMCNLTNDVKHKRPVALKKEEVDTNAVISAHGLRIFNGSPQSSLIIENMTINGKPVADFSYINGNLETKDNGVPVHLMLTKENKIKFHGEDYEVIPFLSLCVERLRVFINQAYDALDSLP